MALTTLSDLKTFLGISSSDTSEDSLLSLLITEVSAAIEEYCDRVFSQATYTETYRGNGQPFFCLNQRPVVSITSLYLDDLAYWGFASGAFGSATLLVSGQDYALDVDSPDGSSRSGRVFNINGFWDEPFNQSPGIITPVLGPAVGNIRITYVAGYSSVPSQIELAANLAISHIRQTAPYGAPLSNERYEEYGYSLAGAGYKAILTPQCQSILSRFRNAAIA